ncbi:MAG: hypothetical protein Q8865_09060 [Bacillota bacterium]|nr:hypothetical protein [Bacillota bacterium]
MLTSDDDPGDNGTKKEPEKRKNRENLRERQLQKQKKDLKNWTIKIILITFVLSISMSFFSNALLSDTGMVIAAITVLFFVSLGILFDIIGIAVATANETSFHSMRSRKVSGAAEALRLIRNAEKVSNFCNDVVGDICGIVSGSAVATIVLHITQQFSLDEDSIFAVFLGMGVTAVIAGLTVGGKAVGKGFAMNNSQSILFAVGRVMHFFNRLLKHKE